jgi:hypothetical protein
MVRRLNPWLDVQNAISPKNVLALAVTLLCLTSTRIMVLKDKSFAKYAVLPSILVKIVFQAAYSSVPLLFPCLGSEEKPQALHHPQMRKSKVLLLPS